MMKILEKIKRFQQQVHEMDNAEKIKNMPPQTTVYDIEHQFSTKRKFNSHVFPTFDIALKKQPYVYHAALNYGAYADTNAQNKVLMHGILFNALFNVYIAHFKKGFENVLLSDLRNAQNEKVIMDFTEYNKLPKRYRGMFVQYDSDHYVLNVPYKNMIMTYSKRNKAKLEKLLLRAKMLIPVIYKTNDTDSIPDIDFGGMLQIYDKKPISPAFVPNSLFTNRVSDEQLNTIQELHDIFVEIAKITMPIKTTVKTDACAIFYEYIKEIKQKDTFVNAINANNHAEENRRENLANAEKAFNQKKQSIDESYRQFREKLLETLSEQTSVRIK